MAIKKGSLWLPLVFISFCLILAPQTNESSHNSRGIRVPPTLNCALFFVPPSHPYSRSALTSYMRIISPFLVSNSAFNCENRKRKEKLQTKLGSPGILRCPSSKIFLSSRPRGRFSREEEIQVCAAIAGLQLDFFSALNILEADLFLSC